MNESEARLVERVVMALDAYGVREPALSQERLEEWQATNAISLPPQMTSLYRRSNGSSDYDERMLRFLPLDEWTPATSFASSGHEHEHLGCLVFAEYSIWVHEYALRIGDGAVVLIFGGSPVPVASSFSDFLSAYVDHPIRLFPKSG